MPTVGRLNEISLFGTYYPIVGVVEPELNSQFAQKQVIGDYTKDSEEVVSSWIVSDERGGIGIKDMDERKDADRTWWSTCWLDTKGHLVLPVLVTKTTNPTSAADPAVLVEYVNSMYCLFGTSVRKWAENTQVWGASLVTLGEVPTDGIVHKGKLYFASGADFNRFDGTTWTDGATLGTAQPSRFFVDWDDKLFSLDNDGQLDYTVDEGVTWLTNAKSNLPAGSFTSLFKFDDANVDVIIYMGTKEGLFALDFDNSRWVETSLRLPFHDQASKGSNTWRDGAYVPSGMAIYEYKTNPPIITPVGIDLDYGVLDLYSGSIVKLLPSHNALYALVDATLVLTRDLWPAGEYGNVQIYDSEGYSAVYKWKDYLDIDGHRRGWSVVALSGAADTPVTAGVIASADDIYRLWFGLDGTVQFIPLQTTIQNPLELADFEFAAAAEDRTPWFDKDNAVVDGLAVSVSTLTEEASTDETVKLFYGLDYDDDTWTLLTNAAFPDGVIDASGEAEFSFGSGAGLSFKAIRFKRELARGSTTTKSPDSRWLRLSYIKLLPTRENFKVRIDCARNYRHRSAKAMLASLKTAQAEKTLGEFQFKDAGSTETYRVRIRSMAGAEIGGRASKGLFDVVLVAP